MGLFSGIKKAVKKVFSGVKKVFSKVGKAMNTKWGKALMVGMAVFTGGMALAAGFQGFAGASGTFMTKFVAGAKSFMGALANPVGQAKKMLGGAGQAGATMSQAQQVANAQQQSGAAAELLSGGAKEVAKEGVKQVATEGLKQGVTEGLKQGVTEGVKEGAKKGWLAQAASGAMDFAKSQAGSSMLKGMAEGAYKQHLMGQQIEAQQAEARRYDEAWQDPSQLAQLKNAAAQPIATPENYSQRRAEVPSRIRDSQEDRGQTYTYGGAGQFDYTPAGA